jgi:aminopeptidase N
MAAIPDFAAGAMENWGLLNYRWVLMTQVPYITSCITIY